MNNAAPTLPLPGKARRHFLLLCLLAAAAAAFLFLGTARAQEGTEYDYVDLIVTYEYSNSIEVEYTVRNIGTATATGVTVSFLLEDLEAGTFETFPGTAPAPPTDKSTVDSTNQSFTWEVGTLPPGGTPGILKFYTRKHDNSSGDMVSVITATASSHQPEPGFLSSNNAIKVYTDTPASGASKHMRHNLLALLLSVEDLSPDAGGDVGFDLTARQLGVGSGSTSNLVEEIEIQVELSDGLKFKESWTPTAADKFTIAAGRQSATWKPDAVDGDSVDKTRPGSREIDIQVQLTSDSLNDIPLKERCITAWVEDSIPPPNPAFALGRLTQCLGDDPPVLFQDGSVGALTPFPCGKNSSNVAVGFTTYPCGDDLGIELAAAIPSDLSLSFTDSAEVYDPAINLRSQGVGRLDRTLNGRPYGWNILHPESVVIHVQDVKNPGGGALRIPIRTASQPFPGRRQEYLAMLARIHNIPYRAFR